MYEDVVDAVVYEVLTDGIETVCLHGHEHLGADAVGAQNQGGLSHSGRDPDHPTEGTDQTERVTGPGTSDQLTNACFGCVCRDQVYPGSGILPGLTSLHASASARLT
jgi:hypothetical protein